jgi:predicted DNA-binding transcriptional regulator AlpA
MTAEANMTTEERLISDGEVAQRLAVSRSWVRKQRFLKRHHLPHVFSLEPVMVGSMPRYRPGDLNQWVGSLGTPKGGGVK